MISLKKLLTTAALLVAVQFSYAQLSGMKSPVSYRLKNGMTVIVAENLGTKKVFANLSFEGATPFTEADAAVQELVYTILTRQLPIVNPALNFTEKGINLATTNDQFEQVLAAMSAYISAPEFTEDALLKAKAEVLAHLAAQDKYYAKSITKASIQKLNVDNVRNYYRLFANPATAYLTIAGNISATAIKTYAKNGFV